MKFSNEGKTCYHWIDVFCIELMFFAWGCHCCKSKRENEEKRKKNISSMIHQWKQMIGWDDDRFSLSFYPMSENNDLIIVVSLSSFTLYDENQKLIDIFHWQTSIIMKERMCLLIHMYVLLHDRNTLPTRSMSFPNLFSSWRK